MGVFFFLRLGNVLISVHVIFFYLRYVMLTDESRIGNRCCAAPLHQEISRMSILFASPSSGAVALMSIRMTIV